MGSAQTEACRGTVHLPQISIRTTLKLNSDLSGEMLTTKTRSCANCPPNIVEDYPEIESGPRGEMPATITVHQISHMASSEVEVTLQ